MGRKTSKKKRKFQENTFKEEEIKGYLVKVKKFAISEDDKARMRSLQDSTTSSSKIANKVDEEDLTEDQMSESEELLENTSENEVCEEESSADKNGLTLGEQESLFEKMDVLGTNMTIYDETKDVEDCSTDKVTATEDVDGNNSLGKDSHSTGVTTTTIVYDIQPDYKTILIERDGEIDLKRRKLPCCMMEQEIVDSIRNHDVVLVTGDTGTGKSTQVNTM
ncbi:RNA helicase [Theileria orientalis]|uniref:RNA helicase n=1 Tax=Theileria orientalis TaxID=68886 RepID=A0A976SIG4_THEOR|nr:RNA helicase [Theileria orientalis]